MLTMTSYSTVSPNVECFYIFYYTVQYYTVALLYKYKYA